MIYLSDVDVVLKLASCGFLPSLPALLGVEEDDLRVGYLVSLKARLSRPGKRLPDASFQMHLEEFCRRHSVVEASSNHAREQQLLQGGMDPGEAILFAEAESTRGIVVTGDKRALQAYKALSTPAQRAKIKVVCWEQLLLRVHRVLGFARLRDGCCAGMSSDKLLALAFSNGLATSEEHALEALCSYLDGVKAHSADILVRFDD